MKIKDGKIAEATESELYDYWLDRFSDIMDFNFYMRRCQELGTKISDAPIKKNIDTSKKA